MDLSRFSLNPVLAENGHVLSPFYTPFYEKLLSTLFEANENAYVKSNVEKDRGLIFMMPAVYWLTSIKNKEPGARALALAPNAESAAILFRASLNLAANLQDLVRVAMLDAAGSPAVSNLVDTNLVVADFDSFREAVREGTLSGRSFGLVITDHAEVIAELPYEILKKTLGHLLPSWERRTLVIAGKHTPRAKNLAWEFADNPQEISLQESLGFAGLMKAQSYNVAEEDKVRFLLSLVASNPGKTMAVFCNLKRTAQELAFRLQKNAVPVDYIVGNLMADRKRQIAQKALSHASDKGFVLVLTDDGAKGLEGMEFPILVNFDIPLEPEFYASRIAYISKYPDEAQLFNFVCERYMYGVPAIERLVDASLNPQPLPNPESLLEDQSAGLAYIPPERAEQRSSQRQSPARQSSHGRKSKDPFSPQSLEPATNLYALSTEERLALFRKKYEKTVQPRDTAGAEQIAKNRKSKQHGGRKSTNAAARGAHSGNYGNDDSPCELPQQKDAKPATTLPQPLSEPLAQPAAKPQDSTGPDQGPKGLLGRLQGLFGSKKE